LSYPDDGVRTAQTAFSSVLGDWAGWFFAIAVLFFGVATILCWAHYGMTAMRSITRGRTRLGRVCGYLFLPAYSLSVFLGAVVAPAWVWEVTDLALAVMTLINLLVLVLMSREVREETDLFLQNRRHEK
jgi:AGCS family alanine or glycine:cation symporter